MKTPFLLLAAASLALSTAVAGPGLTQTTKTMLTHVDPATLTTAWRATQLIGVPVYDDAGSQIGKVADMLVAANGTVPYALITTLPPGRDAARTVVVAASNFELIGDRLTIHNVTATDLLSLPNF